MPLYVGVHKAPGLQQEEFALNAADILSSPYAQFQEIRANIKEGFILSFWESESAENVVAEFERAGFPHQEVHEMTMVIDRAKFEQLANGQG